MEKNTERSVMVAAVVAAAVDNEKYSTATSGIPQHRNGLRFICTMKREKVVDGKQSYGGKAQRRINWQRIAHTQRERKKNKRGKWRKKCEWINKWGMKKRSETLEWNEM